MFAQTKKLFQKAYWIVTFLLIAIIPLLFSGKYISVYETPKMICMSMLALILSFGLLFTKSTIKLSQVIFTLVFAVFAYLNIRFSMIPSRSLFGDNLYSDSFIALGLYFVIASGFLYHSISKNKSIKAILISGLLLALVTIWHWYMIYTGKTGITYDGRVTATIGQPNILGGILAGMVPLAYYYLKKARFKSLVWTTILSVFVVSTLLTMSRGAIVAVLAFGLIEIYILLKSQKRRFIYLTIIILAFSLIAFSPPINTEETDYPYLVERLLSFKDRNRIHDFRFDIWKIAYRAYTKRPLLGWGNANFQNAYQANIIVNTDNSDSYFREVESSHNIFMDILSEWGLIGIILTITSLWYVFRLKGNIFDCYIKLSILVVFIKGMFEFYSVVNWIFLQSCLVKIHKQ